MTDTTQRPGSGAPSGWDAAPAPTTPLPAHDQRDPSAAPPSYAGRSPYDARSPYDIGGPPAPGAPAPWAQRPARPRAPWFWPVVVAAVGLGALLAGGGAGFALGHAIGAHQQSTGSSSGRSGSDPFGGRQGSDPFGGGQGSNPFGGSDSGTQQLPGGGSITPQGGTGSGS